MCCDDWLNSPAETTGQWKASSRCQSALDYKRQLPDSPGNPLQLNCLALAHGVPASISFPMAAIIRSIHATTLHLGLHRKIEFIVFIARKADPGSCPACLEIASLTLG